MRSKLAAFAFTAAAVSTAGVAEANGLDRISIPPTYLFQDGRYLEFRFAYVDPDASGSFAGGLVETGNITETFTRFGGAYKQDINDKWSFALDFGQPHGIDVAYPVNPFLGPLSNASVNLQSDALTALVRYKFNDRFSVYGGPRLQRFRGDFNTAAAGGLNLDDDNYDTGYLLGVAYERSEISLRVLLTYTSEFTHDTTSESSVLPVSLDTTIRTPQQIQLAFQVGIAPETLLFGSYRYSEWSDANIDIAGATVTDFPDVHLYTLGIGRNFTDNLFLSASYQLQVGNESPTGNFSPVEDRRTLGVGARYQATEQLHISAGVAYTWLGDATTVAGGSFTDNKAVSFGLDIGYNF